MEIISFLLHRYKGDRPYCRTTRPAVNIVKRNILMASQPRKPVLKPSNQRGTKWRNEPVENYKIPTNLAANLTTSRTVAQKLHAVTTVPIRTSRVTHQETTTNKTQLFKMCLRPKDNKYACLIKVDEKQLFVKTKVSF